MKATEYFKSKLHPNCNCQHSRSRAILFASFSCVLSPEPGMRFSESCSDIDEKICRYAKLNKEKANNAASN